MLQVAGHINVLRYRHRVLSQNTRDSRTTSFVHIPANCIQNPFRHVEYIVIFVYVLYVVFPLIMPISGINCIHRNMHQQQRPHIHTFIAQSPCTIFPVVIRILFPVRPSATLSFAGARFYFVAVVYAMTTICHRIIAALH